jgi:hypothetical protein
MWSFLNSAPYHRFSCCGHAFNQNSIGSKRIYYMPIRAVPWQSIYKVYYNTWRWPCEAVTCRRIIKNKKWMLHWWTKRTNIKIYNSFKLTDVLFGNVIIRIILQSYDIAKIMESLVLLKAILWRCLGNWEWRWNASVRSASCNGTYVSEMEPDANHVWFMSRAMNTVTRIDLMRPSSWKLYNLNT